MSLDDKYTQNHGRVFLSGTQALARVAMMQRQRDLAAGLNTAGFISGYRGSPLGGLDKVLWQAGKYLRENHIHFQPGLNEDLAATAIWGSQQLNIFPGAKYDGVFSLWYGKGPGVDRSGDVFKHANAAGTSRFGGVLVAAGDDHGCKSSTLAHQSEFAFIDAMMPVLNPAGVQEIIDFGLHGWAMSRFSGCWVGLKVIADTADASYSASIDPERVQINLPSEDVGDVHIRWPDKPLEQEQRLHTRKLDAALAYARVNQLNRITHDSPSPRFGIVSTGKSWLDVLQALDDLGIDEETAGNIGLRILKVGMSWPLESGIVLEFAQGLDEVLVVEEKRGLIEDQLTSQLYNWHTEVRPIVVGKKDEQGAALLGSTGELTPAMIARVIAARIERFFTSENIKRRLSFLADKEQLLLQPKQKLERVPHFCSGCPHNTSTVVPEGSRAMAGIGCHYMATWMDRRTDTFTQMGGEGATWLGQAPFTSTQHVFQNLGDGTYFHSGILAIRAAVAAGVNITYKILYNDAVAMTGGQHVDGQLTVADVAQQLRAEGVRRIAVVSEKPGNYKRSDFPSHVTFSHRDDLDSLQRRLREEPGTTVLIYDQTCAAEKRRRRKKGLMEDPPIRAFINTSVCEGCGDCGVVSNCLSLVPEETPYGRKRRIDQSSCNKDMSCVKGFCPSFVTVHGGSLRKPELAKYTGKLPQLPDPVLPDISRPYGIVLAGVGGTGVTTLGALLGMAAHLEKKGSSVLDMTGLAQKFGAVISHVQIASSPESIHAARIAAGDARVLLGCDLVVAASDESIAKLDPQIASAVVNSHQAMTAEFTRNPDSVFPQQSMQDLIRSSVGQEDTWFISATEIVEKLLGSTMATNLFIAGFAWQKGLIPISAQAMDQAIELNGVEIDINRQAFLLGRHMADNPDRIFDLLPSAAKTEVPLPLKPMNSLESLEALISDRRRELSAYQNRAYAERYEKLVRQVSRADPTAEKILTRSVARDYFRLLAYKDEYEVARLYTDGRFQRSLEQQFEGDYRLQFHLAPPLFAPKDPVSGVPRKITLGGWMMPVFRMLAKLRFLRGTRLDPFVLSADRKLDRKLIEEYEVLVKRVLEGLEQHEPMRLQEILNLIPEIRGFGHIRQRNAELTRAKIKQLWQNLEDGSCESHPVTVVDAMRQ